MATIRDVAKMANVSLGTVSNVLNGKRVSSETVKKVQDAIKELNYTPNVTARSLKTNRTRTIAIVLPSIGDPMYAELFAGIERVLNSSGYTAVLYTTSEIPANESRLLLKAIQQNCDGLILVTCQPDNNGFMEQLDNGNVPFVLVGRDVEALECNFVGFDNRASIFFETVRLLRQGVRRITLVTGPRDYSTESDCISAVHEAYDEEKVTSSAPQLIVTNADRESSFKAFIEATRDNEIPECIITTSIPILEGILQALYITKKIDVESVSPRLISLGEDTWIYNYYPNTMIIPRRAMRAGEKSAELVIDAIENSALHEAVRLMVSNRPSRETLAGGGSIVIPRHRKEGSLRVMLLKGNASEATEALLSDFEAQYGVHVELTCLPYEELYNEILLEEKTDRIDVFQIDLPWFPELVYDNVLLPLDDFIGENPEQVAHFIPDILESYAKIENRYYALPYLIGTQLLFYRKDLFENPSLRLQFWEQHGMELLPPKNWTEFNAIARFFTRSFNPESPVEYGTTLGASFSSGAMCEFMPRMWAYNGKSLDQFGKISLNSKETIRALENYVESFRFASPDSADQWWDEQVLEFCEGKAAMMVLFVAHATDIVDRSKSKVVGKIGYASIPGGSPILGGWSLGVNRLSRNKKHAFDFISWASGRDLSFAHTILGGATPSLEFYKSSEIVGLYPWLPKVLDNFPSHRKREVSKVTTSGKISERQFENIVGKAVHEAVAGLVTPEEAILSAHNTLTELQNHIPLKEA